MQYKYDKSIDALWINIQEGVYDDTIEVTPDLYVDYDKDKNVLRIELLNASKMLKEISDRHSERPEVKASAG